MVTPQQQQPEEPGITFDLSKPQPNFNTGTIETFDLGDGRMFSLPAAPANGPRETSLAVDNALAITVDFIKTSQRIEGDPTLTPMGKANKRQPIIETALKQMVVQWVTVATSLKRSPLPWFEDSNLVEKAWIASRDAAAPVLRAELETEATSVRWAQLAIRRLAEAMCKGAGLADTTVLGLLKGLDIADPAAGPFRMPQTVPAKAA